MAIMGTPVMALKISNIKIEDVTIDIKKIGKTVPISLSNKPFIFQTPFLEIMGELEDTSYPNIYQLRTLFKGDSTKKIDKWYNFIENLETHIIKQLTDNGAKIFSQKNIVFKPFIRVLDPVAGTSYIKWSIDLQNNVFVDEYKESFSHDNLKQKDFVKIIAEVPYLWIQGNQCGLAIIVQKVLVKPYIEKLPNEYIFNDESSSEDMVVNENGNKAINIISLMATEQKSKVVETSKNKKIADFKPNKIQTKPLVLNKKYDLSKSSEAADINDDF